MKIRFLKLEVTTRQSEEVVDLSSPVTFFHGPVSTGKSTIGRMIDYCLGGQLERTPAVRSEFVAARLFAQLGSYEVQLERGAEETSSVRVTWDDGAGDFGSVNAPFEGGEAVIYGQDVYNLSDLIFKFCGVEPIRVRRSKLDPDSPLIRLSFRDITWYCYLKQDTLDSSFFRMEDPFRRLKSRDVMRFLTGLHSERINELEGRLVAAQQSQRTKREAVEQIRQFMRQFELGNDIELAAQIQTVRQNLTGAIASRDALDASQRADTHTVEPLRVDLRRMSADIDQLRTAIADIDARIVDQESLRSELITTKIKAGRVEQAGRMLGDVQFLLCPRCGAGLHADRFPTGDACYLCGNRASQPSPQTSLETEALRRDLNARIDDLEDSIARHKREVAKQRKLLATGMEKKATLDAQLAREMARYDSTFVASVRAADRDVATLQERLAALEHLTKLPAAINDLEHQAGALQGDIDNFKSALADERDRLVQADVHIKAVADMFLRIMLDVGFPGVYEDDRVHLDPRNWLPYVVHGDQEWTFMDAGSGGKKTLFNVCYALAVHKVAAESNLPLPSFLIIDSPTKNISQDENPELVASLYQLLYGFAAGAGQHIQFILIDSDLVEPTQPELGFTHRRLSTEPENPPLISYYRGP